MSDSTPTRKTVLDPNFQHQYPSSSTTPTEDYDETLLDKSGKDRLAKLKEYREKGILTSKDYDKRVKELFDKVNTSSSTATASTATTATTPTTKSTTSTSSTPTRQATTPAATTTPTTKQPTTTTTTTTTPVKSTPVVATTTATATAPVTTQQKQPASSTSSNEPQLSQKDREDLQKLEKLVQSGILTQSEFDQKKNQILTAAAAATTSQKPAASSAPVTQVASIATKPKSSTVTISAENQQQLDKLQKLVNAGILTQSEFDQKKQMILAEEENKATTTTSTPAVATTTSERSIPIYVNNQKKDTSAEKVTTQLVVRVTNVRGSTANPFELVLNGQSVMYKSTEDIPENKEIVVRGDIPHMSNEELEISIDIKMMELGVDATQHFNLSKDGRFIQIGMTSDNKLSIKQQTNEVFDAMFTAPKPTPQPVRASGKTDIFLKFYGLKASSDLPFEIYYMDRLLYSATDDMPPRQIGCVTGQILKERRVNDQSEDDHIVLLRIKCPKIGVQDATATINLSQDGGKLYVEVSGEDLIVKQSVSDEEFETEFKVVDLQLTRSKTEEISEKDFETLKKLKSLFDAGILSEEEYQTKKDQILKN